MQTTYVYMGHGFGLIFGQWDYVTDDFGNLVELPIYSYLAALDFKWSTGHDA